jgi:protein SCO1/2
LRLDIFRIRRFGAAANALPTFAGALLCVLLVNGGTPCYAADLYALPAAWTDDQGSTVRLEKFRGSSSVISMAYGACRKVCSTTMRRMEQLQELADSRGLKLQFILISLDPESDTPQAWHEYREMHHLQRANWAFLSGPEQSTRAVATRLGVGYWRYDEHVLHDFGIALLSPSGEILRKLTWQDQRLDAFLPPAVPGP